MEESIMFIIGIVILILGFPLGNFLARITKEELKSGQKWFKILIILFSVASIISILTKNDILLFTFLFMIIITSRSLIQNSNKKYKKLKEIFKH
ncbi:MAG: hypothetical protein WDZ62_02465 [Candidatus Pacearchaeota archaeon]